MTDNKFEKELDRQAVPLDFKLRIIDLAQNNFTVPDVGLYDAPLRYFAANEQWCKIIFGWLSWLESTAGWKDAEDENHAGIQGILLFEEGIDMENDIYNGIYRAVNDIAKQIVSGGIGGFSVAEDGTVTVGSGAAGDTPLPEDDPTTGINETETVRMGVAIETANRVNEFIARLDGIYGTDSTEDNTLAYAQDTIEAIYPVDQPAMDTAISNYWTYRGTAAGIIGSLGTTNLYQYLYCEGYEPSNFAAWVVDGLAITPVKEKVIQDLIYALNQDFFMVAYDEGITKPSTSYLDASCVPTPPQSFIGVPFNSSRQFLGLKALHRVSLKFEGYATDADGDIQDAFWYRSAAGVLTRTNPSIVFGAGSNVPSDNQVPYNSAHVYEYTDDLPNLSGPMTVQILKHANMTTPTYSPDAFKFSFFDYGEI